MTEHEDRRLMAVPVGSMHTAISTVNVTESAHLLLYMVPDGDTIWMIFKDDSWLRDRLANLTPGLFRNIVR